MQHNIHNYTMTDLMIAVESPNNTIARQDAIEQEIHHRQYKEMREIEALQPINMETM
jgi:hypothetical protein